jgi:DNA repair exonuclease SbcCD ATPase subunit
MIVSVKNFKCWEEATFDIADKGITLISGNSGCGKTSILQAIHFALYGKGTKVVRAGSTSCRVELHVGGMHIVRTKKPNRLVINNTCEDDVAQEIINKRFGKNFTIVSYIEQESFASIVHMTPLGRLQFLESFAFDDVDIVAVKDKLRDKIQECETRRKVASALHDASLEQARLIPAPACVTEPATANKNIETVLGALGALKTRRRALQHTQQAFLESKSREGKRESLAREISDIESDIAALAFPDHDAVARARVIDDRWKKCSEYARISSQYNEQRSGEAADYNVKVASLTSLVWNGETKTTSLDRVRELRNQRLENAKYTETTQKKAALQPLEDEYSRLLPEAGHPATCPACQIDLSIVGNRLFKSRAVPESRRRLLELKPAHDEYIKLDTHTYTFTDIGAELDALETYINKQLSVEKELADLAVFRPSRQLESLRMQLAPLEKHTGADITAQEYEAATTVLLLHDQKLELHNHLCEKLRARQNEYAAIPTSTHVDVSRDLAALEADISASETELVDVKTLNDEWAAYTEYTRHARARDEALGRAAAAAVALGDAETAAKNTLVLREIISKAESICLESTIATINIHAQEFLDAFFPSHPLVAKIAAYKDVKTKGGVSTKPQIDLKIEYKGNDVDADFLSGGERARVSLAFTLALAEIYKSPLIMLDESISSLDHESTVDVLSAIKEILADSTVICVSHQATEGIFDNVINI